jgi:hypothetical protein
MPTDVQPEIVAFSQAALEEVDALAADLAERVIAGEAELAVGTLIPTDDIRRVCVDSLRAFYR